MLLARHPVVGLGEGGGVRFGFFRLLFTERPVGRGMKQRVPTRQKMMRGTDGGISLAGATSTLVVGEIDGETALLTTAPNLLVCRLPLALLPAGIAVGACTHTFNLFALFHSESMLSHSCPCALFLQGT